jgi:hypothetical protein
MVEVLRFDICLFGSGVSALLGVDAGARVASPSNQCGAFTGFFRRAACSSENNNLSTLILVSVCSLLLVLPVMVVDLE